MTLAQRSSSATSFQFRNTINFTAPKRGSCRILVKLADLVAGGLKRHDSLACS
jgi:hypothetical protein